MSDRSEPTTEVAEPERRVEREHTEETSAAVVEPVAATEPVAAVSGSTAVTEPVGVARPAAATAPAAVTAPGKEPGHLVDGATHEADDDLAGDELPTLDPTRTRPAATVQPDGRTTVVCPRCRTEWQGDGLRPHANWFCQQCQFPLFWANAGVRTIDVTDEGAPLRRMPGTGGRDTLAEIDCPTCGERNLPANCWRCGHPLAPPEPPREPAQPAPVVVAQSVVIPPPRRIWPWIVATGVLATVVLVLLIILLID